MASVLPETFLDRLVDQGISQGITEGIRQGIRQGISQGSLSKARQMTLELLETRFGVSAEVRQRVNACSDIVQIDAWFKRAINAETLVEVFADASAGV